MPWALVNKTTNIPKVLRTVNTLMGRGCSERGSGKYWCSWSIQTDLYTCGVFKKIYGRIVWLHGYRSDKLCRRCSFLGGRLWGLYCGPPVFRNCHITRRQLSSNRGFV